MAEELGEAEQTVDDGAVLPDFGRLAEAWEQDASLRHRILQEATPHLTRWASRNVVGAANTKAMGLNARLLEIVATVWCPLQDTPRALPVEYVRKEACQPACKCLSASKPHKRVSSWIS